MHWIQIVNDATTAIVTIAGLIAANKKWPFMAKAASLVEQNAGAIAQGAEAVVKDIVATPAGAVIKHQLQAEVDKVSEQFRKSEIGRLALIGLHSFGTTLEGLSDTQKVALTKFVVEATPASWNVTDQEVTDALNDMQQAANDFTQLEIVKAANVFTEAQRKAVAASSTAN